MKSGSKLLKKKKEVSSDILKLKLIALVYLHYTQIQSMVSLDHLAEANGLCM